MGGSGWVVRLKPMSVYIKPTTLEEARRPARTGMRMSFSGAGSSEVRQCPAACADMNARTGFGHGTPLHLAVHYTLPMSWGF